MGKFNGIHKPLHQTFWQLTATFIPLMKVAVSDTYVCPPQDRYTYSEFSLIHRNMQRIWWINKFGRLTEYSLVLVDES